MMPSSHPWAIIVPGVFNHAISNEYPIYSVHRVRGSVLWASAFTDEWVARWHQESNAALRKQLKDSRSPGPQTSGPQQSELAAQLRAAQAALQSKETQVREAAAPLPGM